MGVQLKIGDKVAVVDETTYGVVHNIENQNVIIEDKDGFLLKYDMTDLVLIEKDQKEISKYIDITHDDLLEKEQSSIKKVSARHQKKRVQPPMEVDLHIHHLVKSTKGMAKHDLLTLQLDTAKRQLEFAIKKRIQRVVFIHGVGKGVLQSELEFLLGRYPVDIRQASFQKYGFGAIEVYIYQN